MREILKKEADEYDDNDSDGIGEKETPTPENGCQKVGNETGGGK